MNEKNIRDYLHLYKGVEVLIKKRVGDDLILSVYNIKENHVLCIDKFGSIQGPWGFDEIKPLLYPLISLPDDKAIEIAGIAFFDQPMHYPTKHYQVSRKGPDEHDYGTITIEIDNDWFNKQLKIGTKTCNLWLLKSGAGDRVQNQAAIFAKLLGWHYDLFGLIEAGLAIGKTTLK